jgi:hypothetical protein
LDCGLFSRERYVSSYENVREVQNVSSLGEASSCLFNEEEWKVPGWSSFQYEEWNEVLMLLEVWVCSFL